MTLLLTGLLIFFGIHSVSIVNRPWRNHLAQSLGEAQWKGLYSLIAIAGFACMVYGYGIARGTPSMLYTPPNWLRHATLLLMLPVFPLLLAAYLPGRVKSFARHPMLAATACWALAHLLANGGLHAVLLFGSFLLWAVVDRVTVTYRTEPVAAPVAGSALNDVIAVLGGLALYVLMMVWGHAKLIGVPVLPAG